MRSTYVVVAENPERSRSLLLCLDLAPLNAERLAAVGPTATPDGHFFEERLIADCLTFDSGADATTYMREFLARHPASLKSVRVRARGHQPTFIGTLVVKQLSLVPLS